MKPEMQVKGGVALQERPPQNSDDTEKYERDKARQTDQITHILFEAFAKDVGPCVMEQMFYIEVPFSRPIDITFDRFYPNIGLLVHSFQAVRINGADDIGVNTDLAEHESYARDHGYNFLPIIDGEIAPEALQRVVKVAAHPDRKIAQLDTTGLLEQRRADRQAEADKAQAEATKLLQERTKATAPGPAEDPTEEEDEDEKLMARLNDD